MNTKVQPIGKTQLIGTANLEAIDIANINFIGFTDQFAHFTIVNSRIDEDAEFEAIQYIKDADGIDTITRALKGRELMMTGEFMNLQIEVPSNEESRTVYETRKIFVLEQIDKVPDEPKENRFGIGYIIERCSNEE